MRVGIVGSGFMGSVHARAARASGAVVVGVSASSLESASRARNALGAAEAFGSVDDLLAAGVDVLHVCAPNFAHFEIAVAAARAGVHVVCEKPLTTSLGDAVELTREAERRGLVGAVPFVYRFHPMVRELRSRVHRGESGRIALASGSYLQDWLANPGDTNWRVDPLLGGRSRTFADIGSHWFDLLEFILDTRVARLSAQFATQFASRDERLPRSGGVATEDTVTVQFSTMDGILGSFSASQVARGRKNRLMIEISGDTHSFAFDQENPESLWRGDERGSRTLVRDPHTLSADAARLCVVPAGHPQGYQECFNAFVADVYAVIRGDRRDGLPTFRDGLRSVRLVEAVIASADAQGEWVAGLDREDAA
jgi:predicted dehydrogenase